MSKQSVFDLNGQARVTVLIVHFKSDMTRVIISSSVSSLYPFNLVTDPADSEVFLILKVALWQLSESLNHQPISL